VNICEGEKRGKRIDLFSHWASRLRSLAPLRGGKGRFVFFVVCVVGTGTGGFVCREACLFDVFCFVPSNIGGWWDGMGSPDFLFV
jgi:hypothetical protein